jgi:hypothetical protein
MTTKREKLLHAELALDPRRRGHPSAAHLETTGFPSAPIPDRVRRPVELLDRRAPLVAAAGIATTKARNRITSAANSSSWLR